MEAIIGLSLPPGFGFHPTDVELISHYLKRKILGHKVDFEVIQEVDIYKHEPWDLPAKCQVPSRDCQWHFFTSRDRKYPNGSRSNRATEAGYWKSTGKDRNVRFNNRTIGTKKTLVFHAGKPPYGKRTDWIMHEYYLNENECKSAPRKDMFVLCRITKRNGLTKEDEKAVSTQVQISPCVSLPSVNGADELQNVSVHLIPKNEACSPVENVDDIEAWCRELYDPNFFGVPLSEPESGDKVEESSLNVRHVLHDKSFPNHIEERNVLTPEEHGFYSVLGHQFNAFELDNNPFELSNIGDIEPLVGVGHPSSLGDVAEVLTKLPASSVGLLADHHRIIHAGIQESIPTLVPNAFGHQDSTVETGIQIRERHGRNLNDTPSHQHRIQLRVHKMESRNPETINQTYVFVSADTHLDSTCEMSQDSVPPITKADPELSRRLINPYKMRAKLQENPTCGNSSSATIILRDSQTRGRISEKKQLDDQSSKSDCKLGSVCASMLSMLRHRKLVEPHNPSKTSRKSHDSGRQACGHLRGVCPLLRKCAAGLNCTFLATCMVGTATLISFFLVRDARRFLCSCHIFTL